MCTDAEHGQAGNRSRGPPASWEVGLCSQTVYGDPMRRRSPGSRVAALAAAAGLALCLGGCARTAKPTGGAGASAPPGPISVGIMPDAETSEANLLEVGIGPYDAYPVASVRVEVIAWLGGVIKMIGPDGKLVYPKLQFREYDAPYTLREDPMAGLDHYVILAARPGWNTVIVPVRSDIQYDITGLDNRFVNGNVVGDYLVGKSGLGVRAVRVSCLSGVCYLAVDLSQQLGAGQALSRAIVPVDSSGNAIAWTGLSTASDYQEIDGTIASPKVAALRVNRGLVAADGSAWAYPPVGSILKTDLKPNTGEATYTTWIADRRGIDAEIPTPSKAELQPAALVQPPSTSQNGAGPGCSTAGGASGLAILAILALGLAGSRRRPR